MAALYGRLAAAADLIKAGADLEAATSIGSTPLNVAAQEGHSEVMKALIEAGESVDSLAADGSTRGTSGTPLYCAAVRGHEGAPACERGPDADHDFNAADVGAFRRRGGM